jgi:hypothetical protein
LQSTIHQSRRIPARLLDTRENCVGNGQSVGLTSDGRKSARIQFACDRRQLTHFFRRTRSFSVLGVQKRSAKALSHTAPLAVTS